MADLRTAEDRKANAEELRGKNIELYIEDETGALVQLVGQDGFIRDEQDIKAVMEERNIAGTVIALRPVIGTVTRGEIVTFGCKVEKF